MRFLQQKSKITAWLDYSPGTKY
ncbi:unnamed protein product [Timema podura]|uniref:Uncharacterized protein n=1 Tax=Timema podura TaxID=61482 RepID=A0ABN7NYX5_TIMPD|nr:unnamed protein product [Timema podura]